MKTTLARNEARRAKARSLRAKRKIIDATSASEIRSIIKARNKGEGFVGILPVAMEKIAEVFAGATWSWVVPGVTEGDSDSLASAMREVGENDKGTSLRFVFAKIEGLPLLRASY